MNVTLTIILINIIAILYYIYITYITRRVQNKRFEYIYTELQRHKIHLEYLNEAISCNLWKVRQDIFNWQKTLIQKEEYEAANQTKYMIKHIEELLTLHNQIIKQEDEINENTNG